MNKKGFLFVVTIFLVLTYILLSISVWVKAVETSERAYSEFYKESGVELAIQQITPERVDRASNQVMTRSIVNLNDYSAAHPLKSGPATSRDTEARYVTAAIYEMFENGSASPINFVDGAGFSATPSDNSTIRAWATGLNQSLLSIGVFISDFRVTNFQTRQVTKDRVNYSFDLHLTIQDYSNSSSVTKLYRINNGVQISGFVDPAIYRNGVALSRTMVYRQFFFPTVAPSDRWVNRIDGSAGTGSPVTSGQGWLYGYLASVRTEEIPYDMRAINIERGNRSSYILVGNFAEITSFEGYREFGGYILTSAPRLVDGTCTPSRASPSRTVVNEEDTFNPLVYTSDCTLEISTNPMAVLMSEKPYVVAPGFNILSDAMPRCPLIYDNNTIRYGRCALIVNTFSIDQVVHESSPSRKNDVSAAGIYDLENLRDATMCGYYFSDPSAPSYFQRMMNDSYSLSDRELGIGSFVIGEYVPTRVYNARSRVDWEIFKTPLVPGNKIRGMPGCKSAEMCADDPNTGIFTLSDAMVTRFHLEAIKCRNNERCD